MPIIDENWLDQNADRRYPLFDGVSAEADGGGFVLPDSLIVDAQLTIDQGLDTALVFISRIVAFGSGLVVTLSIDGLADIATATLTDPSGVYRVVNVAAADGYQVTGSLTFGPAAVSLANTILDYTFVLAATRLIPTTVLAIGAGVSSITVVDSLGQETRLTGQVTFSDGQNASLTVNGQDLEFAMDDGVVLGDPCACPDPSGQNRQPIRSINGVQPDANGDLRWATEGCPELTPIENGLLLNDKCAEPCCGSVELETLGLNSRDLDRLLAELANAAAQVETRINAIEMFLST